MTKKCSGCGAILQTSNGKEIGYVRDSNQELCERCFRIRHYGEYQTVEKDNQAYLEILKEISKTGDLVILVVDLFNINQEVRSLAAQITNPCLLVLTKRDLFPKDIYNQKFITYTQEFAPHIVDQVIISSQNNFQFDSLYDKIKKYQQSQTVYVVGLTNAGKSTMLNKLIQNYSDLTREITTSMLPSTTIQTIAIPFSSDLTLVDTPGILDHSIANVVTPSVLKRITPKKMIRPITYQIKVDQSIVIDELVRIDVKAKNDITLFFSSNLKIERYYKNHDRFIHYQRYDLKVPRNHDIIIAGLGFIKVVKPTIITLYTLENVEVSIRPSLI